MSCPHSTPFDTAHWVEPAPSSTEGCQGCRELGDEVWSHLRMCLSCGHVGCCDSSPHRHAENHHRDTGHPLMRSYEPGESWRWCYLDEQVV